jgi:hypothetical protein
MTALARAQRRVDKTYARMIAAKTTCWRHAWGDSFKVCVMARNALRTVAEVRELEKKLGLI